MVMLPDNKDAALLPHRIDGRWQMLHRPNAGLSTDIWLAESPDLQHWGRYRRVLGAAVAHGGTRFASGLDTAHRDRTRLA